MTDQKIVTFVQDPFGLPTLEVAKAQESSEDASILDEELTEAAELHACSEESAQENAEESEDEIDEEPLTLSDDTVEFERIAQALSEAEAETAKAAADDQASSAPAEEEDQAARLAAEIAEDRALQESLQSEESMDGAPEIDEELLAALPKDPATLEQDETGALDLRELESCLEALLFMTDKPVSLERLQELLGPDFSTAFFQEAMTSLRDRYRAPHHGIEIVEVAGGLQFRTKPGRAALAKKLAKVTTQRLSSGAMQTLAIIAYRQPAMKEDVDKIRGVDSSYFIRGLLERKLIQISGRSELPGRPMLYTTTPEFLELFGLKDLAAMPSLHEIEKMIPSSQSSNPDSPDYEDPRVKEMRRLVGQMKSDTSTTIHYNPREDEKILREIRERINSIPTSTPYLEEQKAKEKQEAELAADKLVDEAPVELIPAVPPAEVSQPATELSN